MRNVALETSWSKIRFSNIDIILVNVYFMSSNEVFIYGLS